MPKPPTLDPDPTARATAVALLDGMRHATLSVIDPLTGHPHLSRILCQIDAAGQPVALLSAIAAHSRALANDRRAALLIEETRSKGDPMTWPRLSLQVSARPLPPDEGLRERWLHRHPRSTLYLGLPDFRFWQLEPLSGLLNAGFGAAFHLGPADLRPGQTTTPPRG